MLGLKGIEITVASKPLLREIIESLPGFGQAAEIVRQARALHDAMPRPEPVDSPLNTGESVAEWIERAMAAEVGIQEAATQRRLLHQLADEAETLAASIFSANAETLVLGLRRHLAVLLADLAATVDRLQGAATAAQAITLGTTDAWRDLDGIVDRHNNIRGSQVTLMAMFWPSASAAAQTNHSMDPFANDLVLANVDQLWPDWRNPVRRTVRVGGPPDRLEPWPADPAEALVWMVRNGGALWLPTARDLEQLNASRHRPDVPRPRPELPWAVPDDDAVDDEDAPETVDFNS